MRQGGEGDALARRGPDEAGIGGDGHDAQRVPVNILYYSSCDSLTAYPVAKMARDRLFIFPGKENEKKEILFCTNSSKENNFCKNNIVE